MVGYGSLVKALVQEAGHDLPRYSAYSGIPRLNMQPLGLYGWRGSLEVTC
jgi:hypothetical protein